MKNEFRTTEKGDNNALCEYGRKLSLMFSFGIGVGRRMKHPPAFIWRLVGGFGVEYIDLFQVIPQVFPLVGAQYSQR